MEIRVLTDDDAEQSLRASRDAFGGPLPDRSAFAAVAGACRWGTFDGPVLAAKATDREYTTVIGGREVSTAGVGGVLVAPEYRARGLARQVMTHLLTSARERGAVVSTLFRTAPALYRSLGYEQVAEMTFGELPAAALHGLRVQPGITVRRAGVADGAAIRSVYARVVAEGSCLLTRTGPSFPGTDQDLLDSFDGITVAQDATGAVVGYVTWNRGENWGPTGRLEVVELHAGSGPALESLLSVVGSFGAVTPTISIRTSGADPLHWAIPGAGWSVTEVRQYLLRVVDLAGAVDQRGWPPGLSGAANITVVDPVCPWNTGDHRLVLDAGRAHLDPGGPGGPQFGPRGLAVLIAGDATTAALRRAGLLIGGGAADLGVLDAAMAGPRPAILDFF